MSAVPQRLLKISDLLFLQQIHQQLCSHTCPFFKIDYMLHGDKINCLRIQFLLFFADI